MDLSCRLAMGTPANALDIGMIPKIQWPYNPVLGYQEGSLSENIRAASPAMVIISHDTLCH